MSVNAKKEDWKSALCGEDGLPLYNWDIELLLVHPDWTFPVALVDEIRELRDETLDEESLSRETMGDWVDHPRPSLLKVGETGSRNYEDFAGWYDCLVAYWWGPFSSSALDEWTLYTSAVWTKFNVEQLLRFQQEVGFTAPCHDVQACLRTLVPEESNI